MYSLGSTEYFIHQESNNFNSTEAGELTDTYMQTLVLADIFDTNMWLEELENEMCLVAEVSAVLDDLTCFLCFYNCEIKIA